MLVLVLIFVMPRSLQPGNLPLLACRLPSAQDMLWSTVFLRLSSLNEQLTQGTLKASYNTLTCPSEDPIGGH